MKTKPLIIAHRGARLSAPENTIAAFELALNQGADGLELDVRLAKDQLIVFHDPKTNDPKKGPTKIYRQTVADLEKHQFVLKFRDFVTWSFYRKSIINFEIKADHRHLWRLRSLFLAEIGHLNTNNFIISSFNPFFLLLLKKFQPRLKLGLLISPNTSLRVARLMVRLVRPDQIHLPNTWKKKPGVRWFFKTKAKIWVWTLNEPKDLHQWLSKGKLSGVITDDPLLMKKALADLEAQS